VIKYLIQVAILTGSNFKALYRLEFQNVAVDRVNGVAALMAFSNKTSETISDSADCN